MKLENLEIEELSARLFLIAINYDENQEKLFAFPFERRGSFAILTQLCVGEKNNLGQYTACLTVTNNMLENWGVTKESLFCMAAENSKHLFPAEYKNITEYLDSNHCFEPIMLPDGVDVSQVFVLTNRQHFNGAATIFYAPEVLDEIAEKVHTDKVMLLPSSINEIYCMPIRNSEVVQEYEEIFSGLIDILGGEELITRKAMEYDTKTKEFSEVEGESFCRDFMQTAVSRKGMGR